MPTDTPHVESITIYQRTYQLPVLSNPTFQQLQQDIHKRGLLIKKGQRVQPKFLGLIRNKEEVGIEERFEILGKLVIDYSLLISFLKQHKNTYQDFFAELTEELKEIVTHKLNQFSEKEKKRQELERQICTDELKETLKLQQQQIFRTVLLLGKASLLMLKKVELLSKGIEKLAEDQKLQREVLANMVGSLNEYKQVYQLQEEIDKLERETIELAKVAVNLEEYLSPFLGSFQDLIDQVVMIDNDLSGTVEEIKNLAGDILGSESDLSSISGTESLSDSLLNFLVTSQEKRERLGEALEKAESTGWSLENIEIPNDCVELDSAIGSIQSHFFEQIAHWKSCLNMTDQLPQSSGIPTREIRISDIQNSNAGIDYQHLEDLLSAQKWEDANQETIRILWEAAKRGEDQNLRSQDLEKVSAEEILTINQLWLYYSDWHFGMSIQLEIYQKNRRNPNGENPDWTCPRLPDRSQLSPGCQYLQTSCPSTPSGGVRGLGN